MDEETVKLCQPERVQVGDRVEILQPPYLAGKIGLIQDREVVVFGRTGGSQGSRRTGRWLVQVLPDEFVVSLKPEEFRPTE